MTAKILEGKVFATQIKEEVKCDVESLKAEYGVTPVSYTHLDVYKRQDMSQVH